MVLTNFECWANGGSVADAAVGIEFGADVAGSHRFDLFNARTVQQNVRPVSQIPTSSVDVSFISSNGYYGFSHTNAPTTNEQNDVNNNNNNNICNYNFNTNAYPLRCKKRVFVDDYLCANAAKNAAALFTDRGVNNRGDNSVDGAVKRCRYDDDFAEQYFNDFFKMQTAAATDHRPPTQIGTQSCLMDTEDSFHNQLQQEQHQHLRHQYQQKLQQERHEEMQQQEQLQQVDVARPTSSLYTTNTSQKKAESNFSTRTTTTTTATEINSSRKLNSRINNNSVRAIEVKAEEFNGRLNINLAHRSNQCTEKEVLFPTQSKLELLFTATHGGNQYHCWQNLKQNQNTKRKIQLQNDCNGNLNYSIEISKSNCNDIDDDEEFCEEF